MTPREEGFLLLTSHLGDLERKVLTVPQLRVLAKCVQLSELTDKNREVGVGDLMQMGFNRPSAQRIVDLLSETERLQYYLRGGARQDCVPVTRVSEGYPLILRKRLGLDSPGCLWLKGDKSFLETPMIALVGSRDLRPENWRFAQEVGFQAAKQGFALVSGNARGADQTAQEACLQAGGKVICVVADALEQQPVRDNVLYISEDGYDLAFSAQRALSRNRVIHALGYMTFVAQCTNGQGGTWHGTSQNLKHNYSPVYCFDDGSNAARELTQAGAEPVSMEMLKDFSALRPKTENFITQ